MSSRIGQPSIEVRLTDSAVFSIDRFIGMHPAERGGALIGTPGCDVITSFIYDGDASTTTVEYNNSAGLIRAIETVELSGHARFKGILHSHPSSLAQPSGQDRMAYQRSLQANSHMGRYFCPIVTHDLRAELEAHQLRTKHMTLSCFVATQGTGTAANILPVRPRVLPIRSSLDRSSRVLTHTEPQIVEVDGVLVLGVLAELEGLGPASLLFPFEFPSAAPVIVVHATPDSYVLALSWPLHEPPAERLHLALDAGTRAGRAPRSQAGLSGRRAEPDLFARSRGLVSSALRERSVLVVGAGSVGSYVAECLIRAGVGHLTVIDPDGVSEENISRSAFTIDDVEQPKVEALKSRLGRINPRADVVTLAESLECVKSAELLDLVGSVDLLIAATDDNQAQARLNLFGYASGTPAVFFGIYRRGSGGEVIMSYPGSACWSCATGSVRETIGSQRLSPETNYGTGRLNAEPALIADIQHVASAGVKVGLALLHEGLDDADASVTEFLSAARTEKKVFVAFGMEPSFWFFPSVFKDALGQHAFQSVWISVEPREDCPVCGRFELRADPLSESANPDPAALRAALAGAP